MRKTKEEEVFNVPANMFKGWEAVGGRLIVNEKKIIFIPHKLNFQTEEVEVEISRIIEIGKRNNLKFVPNGFYIKDVQGVEFKFVVFGRNKIIEYLSKKIIKI